MTGTFASLARFNVEKRSRSRRERNGRIGVVYIARVRFDVRLQLLSESLRGRGELFRGDCARNRAARSQHFDQMERDFSEHHDGFGCRKNQWEGIQAKRTLSENRLRGSVQGDGALESSVAAEGDANREHAQAIAALCIGGVVVARAMRSEAGADALREACMAIAMEIGGFEMRGAGDGARTNRRRDKVARELRVRD